MQEALLFCKFVDTLAQNGVDTFVLPEKRWDMGAEELDPLLHPQSDPRGVIPVRLCQCDSVRFLDEALKNSPQVDKRAYTYIMREEIDCARVLARPFGTEHLTVTRHLV